jgi:hypothetical protein
MLAELIGAHDASLPAGLQSVAERPAVRTGQGVEKVGPVLVGVRSPLGDPERPVVRVPPSPTRRLL